MIRCLRNCSSLKIITKEKFSITIKVESSTMYRLEPILNKNKNLSLFYTNLVAKLREAALYMSQKFDNLHKITMGTKFEALNLF